MVYLAAGMGYLLPEGAAFPLRYLAAVAAVAGNPLVVKRPEAGDGSGSVCSGDGFFS